MEKKIINTFEEDNDSVNLRAEIEKYLIHWKWLLVSGFICLVVAFAYVKSTVKIYETKASVLIKAEESSASELQAFQDLTSGAFANKNVVDEVAILKSRTLGIATIKKLNLNYAVFQRKGLKKVERFANLPIKYQILSDIDELYKLDTIIDISILNKYEYSYEIEDSGEVSTAKFGEKLVIGKNELLFTPTDVFNESYEGESYKIVFNNIDNTLENYIGKIGIASQDDSNVIELKLQGAVKAKAQLVLNTMIDLYNQLSIEDKNIVGKKTDEFIEDRLKDIKIELDEVDRLEEIYKKDQKITDIGAQSEVFIDGKSDNESEVFKRTTELSMVNYMINYINKQETGFELLPANIGVEGNDQLGNSVANYNKVLVERNRLVRSSSIENPVVKNLNSELLNLKANIEKSLRNTKDQLEITINSLNKKEAEFDNRIKAMPKQVREYRSILRRQEIIADLYSYLLQKKEENKITMAVTIADAKIIDRAYSNYSSVGPKKKLVLLIGLIIGVIIPIVVIYLNGLFDTKFHSKKDLEGVVSVPLLGDIPLDKTEEKITIKKGSRTSTAEAFRILRTNLDFMLSGVKTNSKTIFVTSTISGEGKTFVAVNTAASLALTGKKVLLVGMDLRAPKITQYLELPNRNGVTNYLVNDDIKLSDLTFPLAGFDNLHILSSGVVPPNPAELLLNPKIGDMFDELRNEFDYIIVDTAPVNLVSDTLMLVDHADLFLYVSRADYLDKRFLEVPERLYQEKRLPNMAFLINGLDYTRGYGYGYGGYGYPKEDGDKSFFEKLFKR